MISTELEKLILTGKAQFKNYAGGWGAIYTIPVPSGKFIIITDISVTDLRSGQSEVDGGLSLKVTDGLTSNVFLFFSYNGQDQPIDRRFQNKIDTFIICKRDTRLRFAIIPVNIGGMDFAPPPEIANEPNLPDGYGGANVLKSIVMAGANSYCPIGINNTYASPTPNLTNEPFPEIQGGTAIIQPVNNLSNFVFNIGYVIVNIPSINN